MRWRGDFLPAWAAALLRKAGAGEPAAKAVARALKLFEEIVHE